MGDPTADWVTAIATVLAAIGTVGAVVLALWLQIWKERRSQPVLSLQLPGTRRTFGFGGERFYGEVWVAVSNLPDRRTARSVEVLLTARAMEDPVNPPPTFQDQPLRWDNALGFALDIPPGVQRRALAMMIGDPRAIYAGAALNPSELEDIPDPEVVERYLGYVGAFPGPVRVPGDIRWLEPDIDYELWFTVTGRDISASTYRATVHATTSGHHSELAWVEEPVCVTEQRRGGPTLFTVCLEVSQRSPGRYPDTPSTGGSVADPEPPF